MTKNDNEIFENLNFVFINKNVFLKYANLVNNSLKF